MLSRVRSHRKLRTATAAEVDGHKHAHRGQHGDGVAPGHPPAAGPSSSSSLPSTMSPPDASRSQHWPPIEWDPLKLNPPTPPVADPPARPRGDSLPGYYTHQPPSSSSPSAGGRSLGGGCGGHERRRPRMHHSDSGFSLLIHDGFDFGFERAGGGDGRGAGQHGGRDEEDDDDDDVHVKGWPSPVSSVDSGKSWFDHDDDDVPGDDDGAVKRSNELWGDAPAPRRRPQVSSPGDANYFIQRGGWKRKGIVFGGKTDEVRQKDDEVFNII